MCPLVWHSWSLFIPSQTLPWENGAIYMISKFGRRNWSWIALGLLFSLSSERGWLKSAFSVYPAAGAFLSVHHCWWNMSISRWGSIWEIHSPFIQATFYSKFFNKDDILIFISLLLYNISQLIQTWKLTWRYKISVLLWPQDYVLYIVGKQIK